VISLEELNRATDQQFAAALAGIFEHSPWIAARTASARPFKSRLELLDAMLAVIDSAALDEQLALIRAHPELAGKAAVRNELTVESSREQQGAGLNACTPEQFARLHELNSAYSKRFGFPFILAVRGHDVPSIIASFERRIDNSEEQERAVALRQIGFIGGYRLTDLVCVSLGEEIMAMLDALARISEQEDALTCSYLSVAHTQTAALLREWMLAANLSVEIDAVGNVVGRWRSPDRGAKTLITGSHYDTVINGGRYDGRLGIVLPIVVAASLKQAGATLPFDLEIVAFADEEGVRFKSTFIGSSAVAGTFDPDLLAKRDANGVSMQEALQAAGFDPSTIPRIARNPQQLHGFIEVHIEQGPVLLDRGEALGVVTAIAGSVRYNVSIVGLAGHAGTVPMGLRQDAAAAAAEVVLAVERRCSAQPGLVGTVGRLAVPGGAINVIPGRCELTLDIRAGDNAIRDAALADVLLAIEQIAARRKVAVKVDKLMSASAAPCAPAMQQAWADSIRRVSPPVSPHVSQVEPMFLPSGAGHDAMKMAEITPMGMLFVRCGNGGISHHPAETMTTADADLAARAFADFIRNFGKQA